MRPVFLVALAATAATAAAIPIAAQQSNSRTTFRAEDALDVVALTTADLTDDGRYAAVISTTRRDAFGTDFRHDGDPTYLRVPPARMLVIDTRSGATTDVFNAKRAVRGARWAPLRGRRSGTACSAGW